MPIARTTSARRASGCASRRRSARFPGHPALEARVTSCRGVVLFREGRLEDALAEDRRALLLQEALLGPTSNDATISLNNIAIVLHELGRDQEAEPNIRRVVDNVRTTFGDDADMLALASANQSEILTALGKFEAARAGIQRALSIWRAQAASAFLVGYGLLDQGKLELAEGRAGPAVATLESALARLEGQDPRFTAEAQLRWHARSSPPRPKTTRAPPRSPARRAPRWGTSRPLRA